MDTDEYKNTTVKELSSKDYIIKNDVIIIKNNKAGLVIFYNFWCGYCQLVKPEIIKLSKNDKYNFYAIHGENPTNHKLYEHFLIQGVPQIRYVHKNGKIGDIYNGERTEQNMLNALNDKDQQTGGQLKRQNKKDLQKGGGLTRQNKLKQLTKPVLLKRIRKHEKKVNTKANINMKHKKVVMIKYIDANIVEKKVVFDLENNENNNIKGRSDDERIKRKNELIQIKANKKKNRSNAKSLYKDIPNKKDYIAIREHNKNKKPKQLVKKEPMKFIKIDNVKKQKIYKNSQEKIEYKIKNNKKKMQLDIIHKQGDEKIKIHHSYPKNKNSLSAEYDLKKDLLEYVRNTVANN